MHPIFENASSSPAPRINLWQLPAVFNFAGIQKFDERDVGRQWSQGCLFSQVVGQVPLRHVLLDAPRDSSGLGVVTAVFCLFAVLSIVVKN